MSAVRASSTPARGHDVALADGLIDSEMDVRKCRAIGCMKGLEPFRPVQVVAESVDGATRIEHLVDRLDPSLVPDFIEPPPNQRLVVLSHLRPPSCPNARRNSRLYIPKRLQRHERVWASAHLDRSMHFPRVDARLGLFDQGLADDSKGIELRGTLPVRNDRVTGRLRTRRQPILR